MSSFYRSFSFAIKLFDILSITPDLYKLIIFSFYSFVISGVNLYLSGIYFLHSNFASALFFFSSGLNSPKSSSSLVSSYDSNVGASSLPK